MFFPYGIYILFLILAVAFAAVFTIRRATKTDAISLLLKAIASLCFILLGCAGRMLGTSHALCMFVIIGLVCGLIGDIFLDLKFVYPKDDSLHSFTGFGAFILGHFFYMFFMFQAYGIQGKLLGISIAAGVVVGIIIYVTPKLMKLDYGKFRLISSLYAALLVFVTVYALLLEFTQEHTMAKLLFAIGLVLFLISDLILSQIYFGKDKNTALNKVLNHAFYYAAQILIAISIYYAGSIGIPGYLNF